MAGIGKTRREILESSGFPRLFRAAFKRWQAHLPLDRQRRASKAMADRLGWKDTKNIRNWSRGVSAPASQDAWAAVRAVLAQAPENAAHLPALDAAFAKARGIEDAEDQGTAETDEVVEDIALLWSTGKFLPAILGLIEFRLRLGGNAGADAETCPVHVVLRPGQSEREVDGRRLLIGFTHLLLRFDTRNGHKPREDSFLGEGERLVVGVKRISGGWRLNAPEAGSVLQSDPLRGAHLFLLEGCGADVPSTVVELIAESGGLQVLDAERPASPPKKGKKQSAVADAIFRERRDPEGAGRWVVGRGEVWQEKEG